MGHPRKVKSTFFKGKSKALNATIINQLRTYYSQKIFELSGIDYLSQYPTQESFYLAPQAASYLEFVTAQVEALVPCISVSASSEIYMWMRRFDALSEKNSSLESIIDPDEVALTKFRAAEAHCKSFNESIESIYDASPILGVAARGVIHSVQRKIKSYLGDVPTLSELHCAFGSGATTTCRKRTTAKWKLSSQLACSRDSLSSLTELAALYPTLDWSSTKLDMGSLSFVPKNAKTSRSIMTEPVLNGFVQKGIGSHIKRKLLKKGCNLYDQSINRTKARVASINNNEATIDLSAASDNIAYQTVRLLLPFDWYEFLATWRTDTAYLKSRKEVFPLHKFSSMGNGYTFELESCIFYACGQVACELAGISPNAVSTYGDDIIVPTQAVDALFSILTLLGFTVNNEKSFWHGPFRESCGGDYFLGVDVRPFYVKDTFTDARLVAYSNQIERSGYPDPVLRKLIESFINPRDALYGPDGFGDGHLIGYDDMKEPYRRNRGYEGFMFKTFTKVPKLERSKANGYHLLPAYEAYLSELKSPLLINDKRLLTSSYHKDWFYSQAIKGIEYSRETDPHIVNGGEQARVIRVTYASLLR
jgi:hypothetical protein